MNEPKRTITTGERREHGRATLTRIRDHCEQLLAAGANVEAIMFGVAVEGDNDVISAGGGRHIEWSMLIRAQLLSYTNTEKVDEVEG